MTGRRCPSLSLADGVLFWLSLAEPGNRDLLNAYRRAPRTQIPIQVFPQSTLSQLPNHLRGFEIATRYQAEQRMARHPLSAIRGVNGGDPAAWSAPG